MAKEVGLRPEGLVNDYQRTCTYSKGVESPDIRLAITLLAGNAFGIILTELRFRGLVMTNEDMLTAKKEE